MASKVTDNVVSGDILIIKELAKHLKYTLAERRFMIRLAKKGAIAVESLLEEAISKVGKIERCNKNGQDFKDKSDAKKSTVTVKDAKTGFRAANICNVKDKNGALRVMVSDPITSELYYFIIPNHELKNKPSIKIMFGRENGMSDRANVSSFSGRCWLNYQVKSFKELCSCLK